MNNLPFTYKAFGSLRPISHFSLGFFALLLSSSLLAGDKQNETDSRLALLEQRIMALEKENGQLKERLKLEEKMRLQPKELADILPQEEMQKKSFLEAFRRELKKRRRSGKRALDQS